MLFKAEIDISDTYVSEDTYVSLPLGFRIGLTFLKHVKFTHHMYYSLITRTRCLCRSQKDKKDQGTFSAEQDLNSFIYFLHILLPISFNWLFRSLFEQHFLIGTFICSFGRKKDFILLFLVDAEVITKYIFLYTD